MTPQLFQHIWVRYIMVSVIILLVHIALIPVCIAQAYTSTGVSHNETSDNNFSPAAGLQQFWRSNTEDPSSIIADKSATRQSFPQEFKLFNLDFESLQKVLLSTADKTAKKHSCIITLPGADGAIEDFEVFEASNFEPDLQARFPLIRAYSGRGITDKYATLKLSISPQGIQTMVFRADKENEFIEPYSADHKVYAVFRSHRIHGRAAWTCYTDDKYLNADYNQVLNYSNLTESSTGELKTMRLAQSCNGEYSNYFGATSSSQVSLVLAAFNATLTRCNGVFEKDLALHLNLIGATTNVIYYNPSTDPYTTMGSWNSQLQTTLTNVIGEANYDIGHMFGASGGGGNAGCIGCVCTNGSKGSGITSPADGIPLGDNFDIDYVAHEIGHQLGANHTFSMSSEGTGMNKEVGSGITIMGYAGITSQDVAPHSIDIFHEASIAQIQSNLAAKTCPITTNIVANNATPVVAPVSNYTIPISTPFALTGSATDANGDPLTYCWEQNDNSTTTGSNSVASIGKATGPNWLSFSPSASPVRLCPKLSTILAGLNVTPPLPGGDAGANIEALSSVSRTLNFRLTVRDNHPYSSTAPVAVGQTAFTNMVVTVSNTSGPFVVTAPNTAVSWPEGSAQTITWNVAATTGSPVSCAFVKISLSKDGGQTFPTVLTASTANDGSELLTLPYGTSITARIKVEAVGNIFFDISNTNFTITPNPVITGITSICAGSTTTLSTGTYTGYVWSTAATSQSITVGSAGTYTVTVTDQFGNTGTKVVATTVVPVPTPTITGALSFCAGGATSLSTQSYAAYNWSDGGSSQSLSVIAAGTYTVTVTAANGCTASSSAVVGVNANPSPTITGGVYICSGSNTTIDAGSYTSYMWSTGATGQSLTTGTGGTYTVTVTNSNGCTGSATAALTAGLPILPNKTQKNLLCYGQKNGVCKVAPTQGVAPYTYLWNTGATIDSISNRTAGNYTCTITDAALCSTTATFTLPQPAQIQVAMSGTPATGPLFNNGSATATPSNGFTPYRYTWNTTPAITTQTASNLIPGTYVVTVKDNHKCARNASYTVNTARFGIDDEDVLSTTIMPNPVADDLVIEFENNVFTGKVLFVLIDDAGKMILQTSRILTTQSSTEMLHLGDVANGHYLLRLTDEKGVSKTHNILVAR